MRLAIHVPHPVWRILYNIQRVFHVQEYWCVYYIALLLNACNLIFQTKREKWFLFDKLIII